MKMFKRPSTPSNALRDVFEAIFEANIITSLKISQKEQEPPSSLTSYI